MHAKGKLWVGVFLVWVTTTVSSYAVEVSGLAKFYEMAKEDIHAEYQKSLQVLRDAYEGRVRSGKVEPDQKGFADAELAIKFVTYNKAVIHAACAADSLKVTGAKQLENAQRCVSERQAEMSKYLKIAQYAVGLDLGKYVKCEMKARKYDIERQLPPYDFLRDDKGLYLLDFAKINECMLAGQ